MNREDIALRLIWWKPAHEVTDLELVVRVMTLGTWEMIQKTQELFGEAIFRQALVEAQPGQFDSRSWNYWHLRFGLRPPPQTPRFSLHEVTSRDTTSRATNSLAQA
jgi:hypothetical protein